MAQGRPAAGRAAPIGLGREVDLEEVVAAGEVGADAASTWSLPLRPPRCLVDSRKPPSYSPAALRAWFARRAGGGCRSTPRPAGRSGRTGCPGTARRGRSKFVDSTSMSENASKRGSRRDSSGSPALERRLDRAGGSPVRPSAGSRSPRIVERLVERRRAGLVEPDAEDPGPVRAGIASRVGHLERADVVDDLPVVVRRGTVRDRRRASSRTCSGGPAAASRGRRRRCSCGGRARPGPPAPATARCPAATPGASSRCPRRTPG